MEDAVKKALEIIRKGGIILYPTDTVWGIGCDATNAQAVKRIFDIKQRDDSKSMIILVNDPLMVARYIRKVPDLAWDLIDMADKPLTIIYEGAVGLAENLVAGDGSVGIRVCRESFCDQLIGKLRRPIVSTSANISGSPTPRFFDEIGPEILASVDYVVEYRQDDRTPAMPSSIISLRENGEIKVIR